VRLQADVDAAQRRAAGRVHEQHVPGRDECADRVRLPRVEHEHVRAPWRAAGLRQAEAARRATEIDHLGGARRGGTTRERAARVDVQRAAAVRRRIGLIDRPDLVPAIVVVIGGRRLRRSPDGRHGEQHAHDNPSRGPHHQPPATRFCSGRSRGPGPGYETLSCGSRRSTLAHGTSAPAAAVRPFADRDPRVRGRTPRVPRGGSAWKTAPIEVDRRSRHREGSLTPASSLPAGAPCTTR
jgi:hypothetical protein